jgi:hypothetical protein
MKLERSARMRLVAICAFLITGADECERVPPEVEVGRYWARLAGYGTPNVDVTFWIEYKRQSTPTWVFVPKTPERQIAAGTDLSTVDEWLYGLEPGTAYDFRECLRIADGTTICDTADVPFSFTTAAPSELAFVEIDPEDSRSLRLDTGESFIPWGNNFVYVRPVGPNALVEPLMYDEAGMEAIRTEFQKLRNIMPPDGVANVVRMHLQLHEFLIDPTTPNREALARFASVIEMAEDEGLRVMLTGLNIFLPPQNPAWVFQQNEAEHWRSQALWWTSMARALHASPGVFAYDLVNEPYATTQNRVTEDHVRWVGADPDEYCDYGHRPELGIFGTCFGQHVVADGTGRDPAEIATQWAQKMRQAIRYTGYFQNDQRHLITIGVGGAFEMGNVFNSEPGVHAALDFLSPHLYGDAADQGQSKIDFTAALAAMVDKPVIVGEVFLLNQGVAIVTETCNAGTARGFIGQYDGRTYYDACPSPHPNPPWNCAFFDAWYEFQAEWSSEVRGGGCPTPTP